MGSIKTIVRRAWGALGPGLTTGAADDDPSGHRDLFPSRSAALTRSVSSFRGSVRGT